MRLTHIHDGHHHDNHDLDHLLMDLYHDHRSRHNHNHFGLYHDHRSRHNHDHFGVKIEIDTGKELRLVKAINVFFWHHNFLLERSSQLIHDEVP